MVFLWFLMIFESRISESISSKSFSVTNTTLMDFRTKVPMYFFMGDRFPIELRATEYSGDWFSPLLCPLWIFPNSTHLRNLYVHNGPLPLIAIAGYRFLGDVWRKYAVFAKTTTSRWVYAVSRVRKMQNAMSIHTLADTNLRWNHNSRATCALNLPQTGDLKRGFRSKIVNHEQPAHRFWHKLTLKCSHFSPKWRYLRWKP